MHGPADTVVAFASETGKRRGLDFVPGNPHGSKDLFDFFRDAPAPASMPSHRGPHQRIVFGDRHPAALFMTLPQLAQYSAFIAIVTACVKPAGIYLARVFGDERTRLDRWTTPVERFLSRLTRVDLVTEMSWQQYAAAFGLFTAAGTALLFGVLEFQTHLPGGPSADRLTTPMTYDLAANTAVSFSTTTTWQAYGGESTMKYWTQLIGLVGQNFLAGAAGLAVGVAFVRGFSRTLAATVGNFWLDLVRSVLWVLLPLCLIGSLVLVWQGVPMTFRPYANLTTVQGNGQVIAYGPVAALELIKNLGNNGGGFFNANGAHPFEGPTPLANFVGMLAVAVLPAALTYTFGRMVGRPRAGWTLYGVMVFLFVVGLAAVHRGEGGGNPALAPLGVTGINSEGKEVRFGLAQTALTAVTTSNGATGSTNAAHDSFIAPERYRVHCATWCSVKSSSAGWARGCSAW